MRQNEYLWSKGLKFVAWEKSLNVLLNRFPNKPLFLCICSTSLLKTLWEKEKLLVTGNFSFSHSVFYLFAEFPAIFMEFEIVVCKLFQFGKVWNSSFGKALTTSKYYDLWHAGKINVISMVQKYCNC